MSEHYDKDGWPIPDRNAEERERLFRRNELKMMGERLLGSIKLRDKYSHDLKLTKAELTFQDIVKEILRCKARQEPFGPEAIEAVRHALNIPIRKQYIREFLEGVPPIRYINFQRPGMRSNAEALVRFLDCFVQNAELENYNPIGVCEVCSVLYIRKRTSKKWCSSICRSRAFNAAAGPKYFSNMASKNRSQKKGKALKLSSQKKSIAEIAKIVHVKPETILGWIKMAKP